jgi:CRP/FNR family transcriptional regulator, anaerobic regulatory protein
LQPFTLHRLGEFIDLDKDELSRFASICGPRVHVERHTIIRAQGADIDSVYLLADGWVTSSVLLPDGERQIVKIQLSGDILGTPSIVLRSAAETLTAMTPCEIYVINLRDLFSLFWTAPRLATALLMIDLQDRVILMDRLTAIGRTSSARRLASLLLHMHDRLTRLQKIVDASFHLPLTQVDLADVLGITPIHMNRVIKDLKATGLIEIAGNMVTLNDVAKLRAFSALPVRNWVRQPAWLPAQQ